MAMRNICINTSAQSPPLVKAKTDRRDSKEKIDAVTLDCRMSRDVDSVIPKKRQDVLKWYGWGYKDSQFYVQDNMIHFKGDKYPLEGCALPHLTEWVLNKFDFRPDVKAFPELPTEFPSPTLCQQFLQELQSLGLANSSDGVDRLIRSHGQTLHDIYTLWRQTYKRIPDLVVWPKSHQDVESIIALAHKNNVVIIPFGGGTSVSGAASCPESESERMICALDTSQMNRMLWLNKENLTVCFEAGIVGQDLERELRKLGLTVGHEPDSYEFSTLGGWCATRASGMKKNVYGNIEDIVVRVRMVTPAGVLDRDCTAPRISCGPDFSQIILGSEGTLGVITEVVLKVRPLPPVKRYGSLLFPDFESGVEFMREVARRRCQPASVRLMDNEQFIFGQSLRPAKGWMSGIIDGLKKSYVTTFKGLDLRKVCAATLLFEGEAADVNRQESLIYEIAKRHKGFPAGGQSGERGYILTFVIAYIRDFGLNQGIVAESFETSVPWDRCSALCRNVKRRIELECRSRNINHFMISCRVTQTYDAGACVYFYFGFKFTGITDPVGTFEQIENGARDEILSSGGSISHHHGVGKVRSRWYKQTISDTGSKMFWAMKKQLDPKNIFAVRNLLPDGEWECWKDRMSNNDGIVEPIAKEIKSKL